MSKIIANKYKIDSILSKGSYGIVCKGMNMKNENEYVAIKIETNSKSLKHETKILNYLYFNKIRKIPAIYWYGIHENNPCLIMTYYECSLLDYIQKKPLDMNKINGIMQKIIDILSQIHKQYVLHRDLKPANFMIKNGELFLIDFGLATFFITDQGEHVVNEPIESLVGSPKYISIRIFEGNKYSRRDDMISLGYICMMMILKDTPWEMTNLKEQDLLEKTDYNEIDIRHPKNKIRYNNRILSVFLERYCIGIGENITEYLKYVYGLEYHEKPKYEYLLELFCHLS